MIRVDGVNLTLDDLGAVAIDRAPCRLTGAARERIAAGRSALGELLGRERPTYGLNTGFGDLAGVRIAPNRLLELQRRMLASHAAGVGPPLPDTAVRAMLLLRANTLARGHSGVRVEVVERLLELLEHDLVPVVPSRGSVGASGDLAPLAHLALALVGRGRVRVGGREVPAADALAGAGLEPLELGPKEGLALLNGTQAMTALLALATLDSRRLVRTADLVAALSTDAFRGSDDAFDRRLHELRPHPGQVASAANLRRLMRGSPLRESHRTDDPRVQDPYSFRCAPQVHGAARDVVTEVERRLAVEINSVTDNPLVFADPAEAISGGNFHGEPMAMAADFLAVALAELGSISERRIEKLTHAYFSGLPPFLAEEPGVQSGFMIAHVTAAALASDNKRLAQPASVDSIPTSAGKEDHVSMGMSAALDAGRVVENLTTILAIELLAAAQGFDLLRPLESSPPLEALHAALRRRVPVWSEDREMADDLAAAATFLTTEIGPHVEALD